MLPIRLVRQSWRSCSLHGHDLQDVVKLNDTVLVAQCQHMFPKADGVELAAGQLVPFGHLHLSFLHVDLSSANAIACEPNQMPVLKSQMPSMHRYSAAQDRHASASSSCTPRPAEQSQAGQASQSPVPTNSPLPARSPAALSTRRWGPLAAPVKRTRHKSSRASCGRKLR